MRLARDRSPSNRSNLLVGIVPPPTLATEFDLEQLFCDAYRRLHGPMLDHAERFLDHDAACDAEADAVANVWYRWAQLTPEQRSDKYFFCALHNSVLDVLRASGTHLSLEDAEEQLNQQAVLEAEFPTRIDTAADVLDAALTVMPRRRREVLLLVKEEGFTYPEAAEVLGLSIGTINTHMRLATKDLYTAFTRAGFRIANPQPARLKSPKGGANHD